MSGDTAITFVYWFLCECGHYSREIGHGRHCPDCHNVVSWPAEPTQSLATIWLLSLLVSLYDARSARGEINRVRIFPGSRMPSEVIDEIRPWDHVTVDHGPRIEAASIGASTTEETLEIPSWDHTIVRVSRRMMSKRGEDR